MESISGRQWEVKSFDAQKVLALQQTHGISEVIATILVQRDIDLEEAEHFLSPTLRHFLPDPSILKDLDKAVERVIGAIKNKELIAIYGDYDVDGATSSALLRRYFNLLGISTILYIPDRLGEGYGANAPALQQLADQGVKVVLMVDCGTTAFEPLSHGAKAGLDIIVLDHHSAQETLPKAFAIVNPNRLDPFNPMEQQAPREDLKNLCAAGVSFLFLVGLQRALRKASLLTKEPDLKTLLPLVSLGTVCDVMPLTGLNRAFVSQGLKVQPMIGINALLAVSELSTELTPYHLGFILGPRINAGGRVGQANMGSLLLTTDDLIEAQQWAKQLHEYNNQRRVLEQEALEESITKVESKLLYQQPIIIVEGQGWHPGVIGIVASRLKDRYHKPAIVISFDDQGVGKGSGRSVSGLHLGNLMHQALEKGLLSSGGGHSMAAGLTVLKDCFEAFCHFVNQSLKEYQHQPTLFLERYLSLGAATPLFLEQLKVLEPFGAGHPQPRFGFCNVRISFADVVGQNHVRCHLTDESGNRLKAMAFRALSTPLGDRLLQEKAFISLAGTLHLNQYKGQETVTLFIEDCIGALSLHQV